MLSQNGTTVLKFYLHISPEEQLSRFKQRLDDPSRHWKISESDYFERELWPQYVEAYEDAMAATSTKHAIVLRRKVRGRAQPTNNDRWFLVQIY
jgi:polyphosphate kinase 2 (PPK2 family)